MGIEVSSIVDLVGVNEFGDTIEMLRVDDAYVLLATLSIVVLDYLLLEVF